MLSKEEILNQFDRNEEYDSYFHEDHILKAMDEYAAIWKEKADGYEKALKEITRRWKPLGEVECPSGIATKAIESFNQNKVK